MRFALALAVAGAVAVVATAGYGRGSARGVPRGFNPESAAAVGTRDLWVLGERALLRSTDAGRHFVRVARPVFPSQGSVPTLRFANSRDGFAYIEDETPLYVTHDGGKSWHRTGPARRVVSFALGDGFVYVASHIALERSPVGRNAWTKLPIPVLSRPVSLAARGSDFWLLGPPRHRPDFDSIALSSNDGRSFESRKGPCLSELGGVLAPTVDGVVWAVCPTGNMAELARSKDGGRSFPSIYSAHDPGGVRQPGLVNSASIAAASARVAALSRGAEGALLRTTDAGRHWGSVPRTARIREVFWLAFTTRHVGAAVVQTGPRTQQLWRTTDAGATWHSVPIR